MRKRFSALLLALVLTVGLLPTTAWADGEHSHPVCGAECSGHEGSHENVTWTAWGGTGTLTSGNYYLSQDVTGTLSITITGPVNLCLNGHKIENSAGYGISVNSGATLNLCDCTGGGAVTATGGNGYGISTSNGGTVNVYGGSVTGGNGINNISGTVTVYGGTVTGGNSDGIYNYNNGTVNVYGGTVTGNGTNGAGIYNYNNGTVNVYGGSVEGKTTHGINNNGTLNVHGGAITGKTRGINNSGKSTLNVYGGDLTGTEEYGIYHNGTSFTLGGNPTITGGTANLYFANGKTVTVDNGGLTGGTYSVKTAATPTEARPVAITTPASADYSGRFTSADASYAIRNSGTGDAQVVQLVKPHSHSWASAWQTDATHHWHECTADGCGITDYTACGETGAAYGTHVYGGDADADCDACGYVRTVTPAHNHPVCGAECSGHTESHGNVTWTGLSAVPADNKLNGGNYYLTGRLTPSKMLTVPSGATVNLCLNGKEIYSDANICITVESGGTLNLCDCVGTGSVSGYNIGIINEDAGAVTVYGGSVIGRLTVGINNTGTLTVYDGSIKGFTPGISNEGTGVVTVYGGSITGGTPGISNTGTLTVHGGSITGGTPGISNTGVANVYGGSITGDTVGINNVGSVNTGDMPHETTTISGTLTISGSPAISGKNNRGLYVKTDAGATLENAKVDATGYTGGALCVLEENEEDYPPMSGQESPIGLDQKEGSYAIKVSETSKDKFNLINEGFEYLYKDGGLVIHNLSTAHSHAWAEAWSNDGTGHWHECTAGGCTAANSEKDGYGAHTPGDWIIDQEATTEAAGSKHKACSVCGYTTETATIPKLEHTHTWGAWTITAEPTTEATGTAERVCTKNSSHKETATLPALTDTAVWTEGAYTAPTEDADGSQVYTSAYGTVTVAIPKLDHTHTWGAWTITAEPTTEATGTAERTCSKNSSHKETATLSALTDTAVWTAGTRVEPTEDADGSQVYTSAYGTVTVAIPKLDHTHTWGAWTITAEPTTEATGTAERTCSKNSSHKETATLSALTDTAVWTAGTRVEPTEDADGSQVYTCAYGTVTVAIPKLDHTHTWGAWTITAEPTTEATGTAERVCTKNGSHKETATLPALTDTAVWTEGAYTAPTEDADGSQVYTSAYGTVTVTIPKLDHTHTWGAWTITAEPTTEATGTAERVCTKDNEHKETATLPALTDTAVWTAGTRVEPTEGADGSQVYTSAYGTVTVTIPKLEHTHTWGAWTIKTAPTTEAAGTAERVCTKNGEHKETATLPALTDTTVWTEGAYTAPTEDADGSQVYTCAYGTVTVAIPKLDHTHTWGAWTITAEPTTEATGTAERVCTKNGEHKETATLPALTDTTVWTEGAYTAPTEDADGSQVYTSAYGTVTVTIPKLEPTTPPADPTYAISGKVTDSEDKAVVGAEVKLKDKDGNQVGQPVTTGSDGKYSFTGVAPGEYVIEITKDGVTTTTTVTVSDKDLTGQDQTISHTHAWATAWTTDATHHWHECTADGCTVTENNGKDSYGAHAWNDGVVTKEPTATAEGIKTFTCTVCAATKTEPVPIPTFNVSGTVTENDKTTAVAGAKVTLKRGNGEIARTTTDEDGNYSFTGVTPGSYNVVAVQTQDGSTKTMTILVTITNANLSNQNLTMPSGSVNSVLDVKPNTPAVVVGGLEAEAERKKETDKTVTVTMTVEGKEENTAANTAEIKAAAGEDKTLEYLEIKVEKKVETDGSTTTDAISTTSNLLTIVIPFDFTGKVQSSVTVYRYHNGSVDTLTTTASGDGERIVLGADSITLYARNFSTYAIGYGDDSGSGAPVTPPTGGDGSSGGSPTTYPVDVPDSVPNGSVSINPKNAGSGATVTVTVKPDEGYETGSVKVTGKDGKDVPLTDMGGGKYTFTMPAGRVTVSVSFVKAGESCSACLRDETCPIRPYTDASVTAWYHDGVHYCIENGLMSGYSGARFGPGDNTSRGMIATILWRLEGSPVVNCILPFDDVTEGVWYTEAIRWAAATGVADGYGNGKFGPGDPITREQLAAMLYRYEQYKGGGFTGAWMFQLDYTDAGTVSAWAYEPMCWTTVNGIINGIGDKRLDPSGSATRAQAATMIMRYCERS